MADGESVLLFGTEFPPSPAGTATYARALALGLTARGVRVHMLTEAPAGAASAEDADAGLPFDVIRIPHSRNVLRRYARSRRALRDHARRLAPDCVWTTNGMGTRVAGLMGELPCPLITCARGSDIRTRLPPRGLWRRLESVAVRRAYDRSAAIAAACGDLQRYAANQGVDPERLFVSHSAFDFARLEGLAASLEGVEREPCTVLTVARLTRQKRIDVVLRALALAAEAKPGLRGTIVGDGPQRAALEALARDLGIDARVRFTGALPPFSVELCAEYRRATACALVSVGEGLSNVLIEAGAFGLPSVGANSGGTPEILRDGETGWLVPAEDVAATAARLVEVLDAPDRAAAMGTAARAWVEEEFGLATLAERSHAALRAIVAGRPLPRHEVEA